jgi:hypothetical protein
MADRPVNPELFEYPKIKKAFRAAKISGGFGVLIFFAALVVGIVIGAFFNWILGLILFLLAIGALTWFGIAARCPRCGQPWGAGKVGSDVNELETFVCRRCRLNIGMGLRE